MSEAEGERDFVGVDFDAGSVVATSYSVLWRGRAKLANNVALSNRFKRVHYDL